MHYKYKSIWKKLPQYIRKYLFVYSYTSYVPRSGDDYDFVVCNGEIFPGLESAGSILDSFRYRKMKSGEAADTRKLFAMKI